MPNISSKPFQPIHTTIILQITVARSEPTVYNILMVKNIRPVYIFGLMTSIKAHFMLIAIYIAQLVLFDASKLIPPETVKERWISVASLAVFCALIAYLTRINPRNNNLHKGLIFALATVDTVFAAHNVYMTRGMASRAVLLFVIPLIVIAMLMSLSALLLTATICVAVYITTAVSYFVNNFNEGYKVELYGEVGFYSAMLYVVAFLLWAVVKNRKVL